MTAAVKRWSAQRTLQDGCDDVLEVAYPLPGTGGLASGFEEAELNDVEHAAALVGAGDDSDRGQPHPGRDVSRLDRGALGSIPLAERPDLDGEAAAR